MHETIGSSRSCSCTFVEDCRLDHRTTRSIWPLLTATMVANAAAVSWRLQDPLYSGAINSVSVFSALGYGQLSVLIIWAVCRRRYDLSSWLLPVVGAIVFASLRAHLNHWHGGWRLADYATRSAVQMLLLVVPLWMLIRSRFWRRLTGEARKWEFSLWQLMSWTTAIAILTAVIVNFSWTNSGWPFALSLPQGAIAPAAVALGVIVSSQLKLHWCWRVMLYLLAGFAVALFLASFGIWYALQPLAVEFMLEALVVAAWIEWGGILGANLRGIETGRSSSIPGID